MIRSQGGGRVPAFLAPIDPERLAAVLSAGVVAIAGLAFLVTGSGRPSVTAPTAPAITRPGAAAASTGPSAPASANPSVPAPAGLATLVDTNVEILRAREDLIAETTAVSPDAGTIARTLRALNPLLTAAEAQTASIAWGASASPEAELAAIYEAAHDASTDTLRASLTSTASYLTGGRRVAEILARLGPITRDLAGRAGVPVPPEASIEAAPAP